MNEEGNYIGQGFVDDAHYDMPLIYHVEGRSLHFGRAEFALLTALHFGTVSFRLWTIGHVKFVSRVLPNKVGVKVTNLDLLGVIEDEQLFNELSDEDVVRVCLLISLEVIFMGRLLVDVIEDSHMRLVENIEEWNVFPWGVHMEAIVWILESCEQSRLWWNKEQNVIPRALGWSRKEVFNRSDYNLLFRKVNVDLTATIFELKSDWYIEFRDFFMVYIPRNAPIKYNDLYEDYFKKLFAARKQEKIYTKDLPMVFGRERTDVSLENLDFRQYFLNMGEDLCAELKNDFNELVGSPLYGIFPSIQDNNFDDNVIKVFVKRLKEEVMLRVEKEKLVNYEREKNKRRHALMNSDHWKASTSRISNCKRSQRSSDFSSYYWGSSYAIAAKDRDYNNLSDQDMTQFLKDVKPWAEELSRPNRATDRVRITDDFDVFLGRRGPLRCKFPWCRDVWVDRIFGKV
ncbi:phospholipase-like protein [Tanacetum coccineum]